jgi:hypothetical protein
MVGAFLFFIKLTNKTNEQRFWIQIQITSGI